MTTSSVTLCYNESYFPYDYYEDDSLEDVLNAWADNGIPGTHANPNINTGGFFNNGAPSGLSGDTYAFTTGSGYAFSVYGSMSYNIGTHVLSGDIQSITFGGSLDVGGEVYNPFLTICFDPQITDDTTVHNIVWGLMNANVQPLLDVLANDYNVDLTDTIASLGDPYGVDCGCDSELVGVPEADDYLLAA